jgi:P4 family phage/plasmid primase-like protien
MADRKKERSPIFSRELAERYLASLQHTDLNPKVHYFRGVFWRYERKTWVEYSESAFDYMLLDWLGSNRISSSPDLASEVRKNIASLTIITDHIVPPCWYPRMAPSAPQYWLALQNCRVAPEEYAVTEAQGGDPSRYIDSLSSRWLSRVVLPFHFNPEATCPKFDAFLQHVLPDDPAAHAFLWEFMGYCLVKETGYHSALLLLGEGGTGKSTWLEVLQMLLGSENISTIPLSDFHKNFALYDTDGKLANIVDEAGGLNRSAESTIKAYISGGKISVDKKYQSRFDLHPTARLIMAANEMPQFGDMTDGVWRRLHVLSFNRQIPPSERILNYHESFRVELPGIFNAALRGLARLRLRGRFDPPQSAVESLQRERTALQPHISFIEDCLEEKADGFVPHRQLTARFAAWAEEHAVNSSVPLKALKIAIAKSFPDSDTEARQRVGNSQPRGTSGVGWTAYAESSL